MDFVKIDGNTLLFSILLKECSGCRRKMISRAENNVVIGWIERGVTNTGVVKESYAETGICTLCIGKGGLPRECSICSRSKSFLSASRIAGFFATAASCANPSADR